MSYPLEESILEIPELWGEELDYHGVEPGSYTRNELVDLLRKHANDPAAILFIADMLEE